MRKDRKTYYHLLLLLPALLCFWACGNLYTGEESPLTPPDDPDNPQWPTEEEVVPVMIAFTDPSYSVLTRGQGAFEAGTELGRRNWTNARFYVYAFRSDNPEGMTFATTRQEDPEICLVDGSTQGTPDLEHGREAKLTEYEGGSFFTWTDETEQLYYSSLAQINPFNFFAYHIDDAVVSNFVRGTDDIRFDLEIDGTQDVLGGVARPTQEQQNNIEALTDDTERENVRKYLYSTYTAHRNFHPVLQMQHYLTRLKFQAFPGNTEESIYIQSVKVNSRCSGTFVVAAKDTTQVGLEFPEDRARKDFVLCDTTGLPLPADSFRIATTPEDLAYDHVYDRHPTNLGESGMLVVPDDAYRLTMELKQRFNDGRPDATYTTEYDIATTGGFKAGTQYTIRIAVYGLEEIKVDVILTPWNDGGFVDVEPDEGF